MNSDFPHEEKWRSIELEALGHLPKHTHLFESREVWAIRAALGARRPLLLRGEPGTGKSELARAAAAVLRRPLVTEVISSRTEPSDLHWKFDAVARLGQAQLFGMGGGAERMEQLKESLFMTPGPLWWVFDWDGAEKQYAEAKVKGPRPARPKRKEDEKPWSPEEGTVLLIDEIDKADPDLPNGLLESLGNGEFSVRHVEQTVRCSPANQPPLIVITTNEERELPAAFVRRCLVLTLALPKDNALVPWLVERGKAHFQNRIADEIYGRAAKLLIEEREAQGEGALVRPGQAEYLDMLRAVLDVAKEDPVFQDAVLTDISGYALRKNAGV